MDNSPRFSEVSVVSSFAYSDELNFAPSTKLRNSQPSLPNQEVPTRPATKRAQPSLSRSTSLQVTEPSRGGGWQRSLRSTKSINDASSRRLDGTVSRLLSTRATDLSSSISSSLSIPDSSVSKTTRASTTPSTRAIQERSALKSSRLAELAHLQEQLEIKSRLLSAMEQQVLNAVQQIEDLQKEQELVKCEKQLLQDECANLRTENAGLNGQMKHLKESRLKLHRRCQEAEEGMSQLKKQLDDMKANSDVACVSADICKAALAQSLSEALAIHFRMLEAQSLLQNCQSELEMHRRHVRQLSDMLEQMHCQLSGALDQLEQATNSERQLKQQLATLQQEVNQALHRLADSQQHHAALQSREVELLEQLEQLVQERLLSVSNQPEQNPAQHIPVPLADKACSTEDCSPSGICQDGDTQEGRTEFAQFSLTIPCALDPAVQSRLQDWLKAAAQQGEVAAQLLESAESSPLAGMDYEPHLSSAPPPMLLHWADPKRNQGEAAESPIGVYRRRPPLANIKGLALEKLLQDPSPRPHHYALLPYPAGSDPRIFDLSTRSSCSLIDVNGDSQPSARSILEAISAEDLRARERAEQTQQASGSTNGAGCQQLCLAPGTIIEWSGPDGVMYRMKLEQLLLSLLDLQQRCRVAMSAAPLQHLGETNSEHASSGDLSQDHDIEHQGSPAQLQTIPSSASESHLLVLDPACSESTSLLDSDTQLQEGDASLPAAVIAAFMDVQFSSDLDQKSWSDSVSSLEAAGEDTTRHSLRQVEAAGVDLHIQPEQRSQLFDVSDVPQGSCKVFDAFDAPCTLQPATLHASTPSISALESSMVPACTSNLPTALTSHSHLPTLRASGPDPSIASISAPNSSLAPLCAPNSSTADSAADSIPALSAPAMPALSITSSSPATSTTEDSTALLLEAQRQLQSVAGQLRCRIVAAAERLVVAEREADLQLKIREAGTLMSRVANSGCWPPGAQTVGTRPSSSDGSQVDGSRDGLDKVAGSSCASSPRPVGNGKRRWVVADPEPLPTTGMDYLSEVFLPENDLMPFQDQLFSISCKPGTSDVTAVALTTGTDGKLSVWTGAQTSSATTSVANTSQLEEFQQEAEKLQSQYNEAVAVVLQRWNCTAEVALYLRGVDQESVAGESSVDDDVPQLPASVRSLVEARSKVDRCQVQAEECKQLLQETLQRLGSEEQLRCEAAMQIETKDQEHSQEVKQLQQLLQQLQELLEARGEKLLQVTEHLQERDGKLGQFAQHLEERDVKLAQLAECLEDRDGKLAHLVGCLEEREGKLGQLAEQVEERDGKLTQLAEHLEERDGKVAQLAEQLEERDGKLVQFAEHLEERDEKLSQLAEQLEVRLKERDKKLAELSQQMESQLTERDLKLAELAEESQQQYASAQQQLLEREAQLRQARAKFEELELQLLLHSNSVGQLPGSYGPLDRYAHRPRRFVLSTSLLEQYSISNPLQQFAMCSAATFIQHHKLNLAMTRTASSHQDSFCCPCAAAAALCLTYNITPASPKLSSTGSSSSACKCCSKSGVRKTSKGRFRLGRRLIFIGMPGAALVMACVWVAELFHPGLADKRRLLRSKLSWHRQKS